MIVNMILTMIVMLSPGTDTVQQELTPDGERYGATWQWCGERFPGQDDLQAACRWGAYEMLPATPEPTEWRA